MTHPAAAPKVAEEVERAIDDAILASQTALVAATREEALEEAAKVCDAQGKEFAEPYAPWSCAAAIRALALRLPPLAASPDDAKGRDRA